MYIVYNHNIFNYDTLKEKIQNHIDESTKTFLSKFDESRSEDDDKKIGVIKYFPPQYLEGFLKNRKLHISDSLDFTWGKGVYVSPLQYPKSSMMYGRIGVLGWYDTRSQKYMTPQAITG